MTKYKIIAGTFYYEGQAYKPTGLDEIETDLPLMDLFPGTFVLATDGSVPEVEDVCPRANHHGDDVTYLFEGANPAGLTVRQKNSWYRLYINGNLHSAKGLRKKEMEQLVSECVAAFNDGGDA